MGGVYPKGYNWLISPETTANVLSQVKTICISSEFIETNQLNITLDEFNDIENQSHTRLKKTILSDWKNWREATNSKTTQLGDPVTLFLAIHPDQITTTSYQNVAFPCLNDMGKLKSEFSGCWYSMPGLEDKLIRLNEDNQSLVQFVHDTTSAPNLKASIIEAIN
ncbi:Uncharacterised protein [Legionella hackeliae]|uniref:Uncharacterized protein n=2 Tax=Legionella hackeliae TaxID=449 RepID=A0A0A8USN7_LEGHA|nr:hypothetical protein Lhac_1343 [Legionella hackeliae]CEK11885.1 conserved protein of unknown function [Legionella hackeliae]STX48652.1 Uncharacterised protein [Legionella hackeliae]